MMQSTGDLSLVNVNVNVHVNPMSSPLPLPLPMSNVKMSMSMSMSSQAKECCFHYDTDVFPTSSQNHGTQPQLKLAQHQRDPSFYYHCDDA